MDARIICVLLLSIQLVAGFGFSFRSKKGNDEKQKGSEEILIKQHELAHSDKIAADSNEHDEHNISGQNAYLDSGEEYDSEEYEDEDDSLELIDLRNMLEEDDDTLLIWKIQDGEPLAIESTDHGAFKSDGAYVVLQGKAKEDTELWNIYYWIGKNAAAKDAADAGSYAVLLDSICHSSVNIRREVEGLESESFQSYFVLRNEGENYPITSAEHGSEKSKKMFLVKGKDTVHISEVDFSLRYVQNNNNDCVVLNADEVYVYCGDDAEDKEKSVAKELAKIILREKGPMQKEGVKLIRDRKLWKHLSEEEKQKIQQFFEEFGLHETTTEGLPKYNSISDEKYEAKRNAEVSLIKISNENGIIRQKSINERPLKRSLLDTDECYVLDSKSLAGVFVWMGLESEIEERQEAVRKAELLLKEKKYTYKTPVNIIEEDNMSIPFELQFADFIQNIYNQKNGESKTASAA